MNRRFLSALSISGTAIAISLSTASADAALIYSQTGSGSTGNPSAWSGNNTTRSVIFEINFDLTQAVFDGFTNDDFDDVLLWEAGGNAGSRLQLSETQARFTSRGGSGNPRTTLQAAHGLTAPVSGVQVVVVWDADDDTTLYVNGTEVGSISTNNTDWSGTDSGAVGIASSFIGGGTFDIPNPGDYPAASAADFTFNVYTLDDIDGVSTGTAVADVLVPEPSSLVLLGLGGLCVLRRRRALA